MTPRLPHIVLPVSAPHLRLSLESISREITRSGASLPVSGEIRQSCRPVFPFAVLNPPGGGGREPPFYSPSFAAGLWRGGVLLTVCQRQRSTGILRYLITRLTLSHEMKFICGRLTQNPLDFFEELCSRDFKLICSTNIASPRPHPPGPSTLHNKQGGISDLIS